MLGEDYEAQSNCVMGAVRAFISYYHSDLAGKGLCESLAADLRTVCLQTAKDHYQIFKEGQVDPGSVETLQNLRRPA